MSQQSDSWDVHGGGNRVLCPKHGIYISNCSYNMDCEACIDSGVLPKKKAKKAQKRAKKEV